MAQITTPARPRAAPSEVAAARRPRARAPSNALVIRPVRRRDLDQVIAIDAVVTGLEKRDYWLSVYRATARDAPRARRFWWPSSPAASSAS